MHGADLKILSGKKWDGHKRLFLDSSSSSVGDNLLPSIIFKHFVMNELWN